MKTFIAFFLLIVGISAIPREFNSGFPQEELLKQGISQKDERIVTGAIVSAIEDTAQAIRDAGLDPFNIQSQTGSYALPVPVLLSIESVIDNFLVTGLSNIVVNRINYAVLTSRLTFEISLPQIEGSVQNSALDVVLFGSEFNSAVSGRFAINNILITGNIRVSVGLITGISIRSLALTFSLGSIESDLNLVLANRDVSAPVNNFLGKTIPTTLNTYSSEINELLDIVGLRIAEAVL